MLDDMIGEEPLTVHEMIFKLKECSLEQEETFFYVQMLRHWVSRVSVDVEPVIESGIIPVLVKLLRDTESSLELKYEITWILTNLANGTPKQTQAVTESGALSYLAAVLQNEEQLYPADSENELKRAIKLKIRDQAIWMMANIAGDGTEEPLGRSPHIELPPEALSTPQQVGNLLWALGNIFRGNSPVGGIEIAGKAAPIIMGIAVRYSNEHFVLQWICWTIYYMSKLGPEFVQVFLGAKAPKLLIEYMELTNANSALKPAALWAMAALMSQASKPQIFAILKITGPQKLVRQVSRLLDKAEKMDKQKDKGFQMAKALLTADCILDKDLVESIWEFELLANILKDVKKGTVEEKRLALDIVKLFVEKLPNDILLGPNVGSEKHFWPALGRAIGVKCFEINKTGYDVIEYILNRQKEVVDSQEGMSEELPIPPITESLEISVLDLQRMLGKVNETIRKKHQMLEKTELMKLARKARIPWKLGKQANNHDLPDVLSDRAEFLLAEYFPDDYNEWERKAPKSLMS